MGQARPPEIWIAQELRRIGDEFNASYCPRRVTCRFFFSVSCLERAMLRLPVPLTQEKAFPQLLVRIVFRSNLSCSPLSRAFFPCVCWP
uniref:Bcl-x interacting BH3 domain-containing protein n=1 Tax=Nothoprocta perdicaria TaxID=30464 RepID=A0A8C6Z5C2_NOTPE